MQTRKTLMISAAAVALTMSAPSAQAASGYVSLFGGGSFLEKPSFSGSSHSFTGPYDFTSSQSIDTSFKTGFVVGGNLGVDWGTFRTDIELAYRGNKSAKNARLKTHYHVDYTYAGNPYSYDTSRDDAVASKLNLNAYSLMANVWYDFHNILPHGITPYVGGGLGLAEVQLSGSLDGSKINTRNDTVFAWQLGAGVSAPITGKLTAFLDYRYFNTGNVHLKLSPNFHGGDVDGDYRDHTVLVGLRINL
jgi:OmpA-OmpF porin, OOP family